MKILILLMTLFISTNTFAAPQVVEGKIKDLVLYNVPNELLVIGHFTLVGVTFDPAKFCIAPVGQLVEFGFGNSPEHLRMLNTMIASKLNGTPIRIMTQDLISPEKCNIRRLTLF